MRNNTEKTEYLVLGSQLFINYFQQTQFSTLNVEDFSRLHMELYHFRRLITTELIYSKRQGIDGQIVTSLQDLLSQLLEVSSQLTLKGDIKFDNELLNSEN